MSEDEGISVLLDVVLVDLVGTETLLGSTLPLEMNIFAEEEWDPVMCVCVCVCVCVCCVCVCVCVCVVTLNPEVIYTYIHCTHICTSIQLTSLTICFYFGSSPKVLTTHVHPPVRGVGLALNTHARTHTHTHTLTHTHTHTHTTLTCGNSSSPGFGNTRFRHCRLGHSRGHTTVARPSVHAVILVVVVPVAVAVCMRHHINISLVGKFVKDGATRQTDLNTDGSLLGRSLLVPSLLLGDVAVNATG